MTTKSFIKTIGEKGLLADYNTEGKKLQTELTAGDNITINGSTISSDQVFVVTYGTTKYQEIIDAYNAGKICTVRTTEHCFYLTEIKYDKIKFTAPTPELNIFSITVTKDDRWTSSAPWLQTHLTFDTAPTAGSKNPVTSDGIKTALDSRVPSPTSTTGTQVLKCIDGVVQWVTE